MKRCHCQHATMKDLGLVPHWTGVRRRADMISIHSISLSLSLNQLQDLNRDLRELELQAPEHKRELGSESSDHVIATVSGNRPRGWTGRGKRPLWHSFNGMTKRQCRWMLCHLDVDTSHSHFCQCLCPRCYKGRRTLSTQSGDNHWMR